MDSGFIVQCPHCNQYAEILVIACGVFRYGVFKESGMQINPHLPKDSCERLVADGLIYGCGKPFKITDKITPPVICDYI
jgi:hypothetical protein